MDVRRPLAPFRRPQTAAMHGTMLPVPLSHIALVAFGGGLGAAGRLITTHLVNEYIMRPRLPWGTFAVNLIGSFLIGVIIMLTIEHGGTSRTRLLFITGLLGGFTTFSAFSFEISEMLMDRRVGPAVIYAAGSVVLCVLGTLAGAYLTRLLAR